MTGIDTRVILAMAAAAGDQAQLISMGSPASTLPGGYHHRSNAARRAKLARRRCRR